MSKKTILKKLKVHALRGATQHFEVEFHKPLTLIYGENGTGKSTICDALDLLGNQKVGSVEGRGLGITNKYWASLGKSKVDISVKLETKTNDWQATVNSKSVISIKPENDVPFVSVLRRSQILSLIQGKPADRFAVIKPFIDISEIENSETELRSLIKSLDEGEKQASIRIDENRASIESYGQRLGNSKEDVFGWARKEAEINLNDFDVEINKLKELVQAINTLKRDLQKYLEANQILDSAQLAVKKEQQNIDEIVQDSLPGTQEVLRILLAANDHFKIHPSVEKCPLCESFEFAHDLPSKVAEKISQLNTLGQAITNKRNATSTLETNKSNAELELSKLIESVIELSTKIEECFAFQSLQKEDVKGNIAELQKQLTRDIGLVQQKELNEYLDKLIIDIRRLS